MRIDLLEFKKKHTRSRETGKSSKNESSVRQTTKLYIKTDMIKKEIET